MDITLKLIRPDGAPIEGWELRWDANKAVFLNHGSATSCKAFKELIQSSENPVISSRNVIVPKKRGAYLLTAAGVELEDASSRRLLQRDGAFLHNPGL
jgi:hypothetical protein